MNTKDKVEYIIGGLDEIIRIGESSADERTKWGIMAAIASDLCNSEEVESLNLDSNDLFDCPDDAYEQEVYYMTRHASTWKEQLIPVLESLKQ